MKYTKALVSEVCSKIESGVPLKHSALACGIAPQTLHRWLNEKSDFRDKVEASKSKGISKLVSEIAADKSWQAKSWILSVWSPEEFHVQSQQLKNATDKAKLLEQRVQELEARGRMMYGTDFVTDGNTVQNREEIRQP